MKTFLLTSLLTLASFGAYAVDKGNGGGGQQCGDKVELYDFYEGRSPILHGIDVWESDPRWSRTEYLEKALAHLKADVPYVGAYVEVRLRELTALPLSDLLFDVEIPRTLDAEIPLVETGCAYVQVANWSDRLKRIFVNKQLFQKMEARDQAGLFLHEILYRIGRENLVADDANGIRLLVAKIFSDTKLVPKDFAENVLPDFRYVVIPKSGSCTLSVSLSHPEGNSYIGYLGNETYGFNGARATRKKSTSVTVPCSSLWQTGLEIHEDISWKSTDGVIGTYAGTVRSYRINDQEVFRVTGNAVYSGVIKENLFYIVTAMSFEYAKYNYIKLTGPRILALE